MLIRVAERVLKEQTLLGVSGLGPKSQLPSLGGLRCHVSSKISEASTSFPCSARFDYAAPLGRISNHPLLPLSETINPLPSLRCSLLQRRGSATFDLRALALSVAING